MMVALGPGKFYGSSLPRPRIYTDIKFNSERVDPPVSVVDPFMSWAQEAHWSMGGLSFNRHRLQGRIEGNVEKLRNQIEKSFNEKQSLSPNLQKKKFVSNSKSKSIDDSGKRNNRKKAADLDRSSRSPSPPPAPVANKRKRRYLDLVDEDDAGELARKWPVRKLSDEFDLVANGKKSPARRSGVVASEMETVASRTRGRNTVLKGKKRLRKVGEDNNGGASSSSSPRTSPRLVKSR
ncbi:hypothetical protein SSX86_020247 [Deinandra increscens subsp. villosa]|uniref:Uncharacterized protein n=1 Tax=Deinandra increscens subsp. villosa TaxID=3103831 RepID=A0AAP0CUF4_9ASTR